MVGKHLALTDSFYMPTSWGFDCPPRKNTWSSAPPCPGNWMRFSSIYAVVKPRFFQEEYLGRL